MSKHIEKHIRAIQDFPKRGILFRDITPLLRRKDGLRRVVSALRRSLRGIRVDQVVGIESRGFIFGAPLAVSYGAGFVPIRKPGKLPHKTLTERHSLEYGHSTLEIHRDALKKGERVLVVDDLLATGGTAAAAVKLVRRLGARVVAVVVLIELGALSGRSKLRGIPVHSVIRY